MSEAITFKDFDKFQRKPFADNLTKVISRFHQFYDEAFVLSLNARYGSGKTTFLRMWQSDLEEKGYKVIFINAWETDFDDEPLIPIVSSILEQIESSEQDEKILVKTLKSIVGLFALYSNQIIRHQTGIDMDEGIKNQKSRLSQYQILHAGQDIYTNFSEKMKIYHALKEQLFNYAQSLDHKPLVILVDEMDRVRPDYAVKFLEAIKHVFSVKGISFVLAVDRKQLEISIKQLYGDIDFNSYYHRFVTREASLRESSQVDLKPFLKSLFIKYFKEENKLYFPVKDKDWRHIEDFISDICVSFEFVPRQVEFMIRTFVHFIALDKTIKNTGKLTWVFATIFLIAVSIRDPDKYHEIGQDRIGPTPIYEYVKKLNVKKIHQQKKIISIVFAFSMKKINDNSQYIQAVASLYLDHFREAQSEEKRQEVIKSLADSVNDFGEIHEDSAFNKIYLELEDWKSFIS